MGRRNDHPRDVLKAMALDAARHILARDGLQALTARRLASEIGYAPGTLYNLFDNLDDLILQVNGETLEGLGRRVSEARRGATSPAEALHAMALAYIAETRREPHLWDAILEHRISGAQGLPKWYSVRIAGLFDLVEDALAPLFPEDAVEQRRRAARVLWSAVHGITSLALAQKLDLIVGVSAEIMVEDLITTYLAGLQERAA